ERGWAIKSSHNRWGGLGGGVRRRLAGYAELPSLEMIGQWRRSDVIVVVSRLSLVLAITARILGKKLLFLDAMQNVPKRLWRRVVARYSILISSGSICFSSSQADEWSRELRIPRKKLIVLPYSVELDYYAPYRSDGKSHAGYLLSVGRDQEREFETLVRAASLLDRDVVLVTHPYLVPAEIRNNPRVRILQNIPYLDLFSVYRNAFLTVVPIRRNVSYMSGIRATMESILLGVPVVVASTAGL